MEAIVLALMRLYRHLGLESISLLTRTTTEDSGSLSSSEKTDGEQDASVMKLLQLLKELTEKRADLLQLTIEQRQLFIKVFLQRRGELLDQLIREHNAREYPLITSFDWDVRLVMGDSNYSQNRRILTTLTLNLYELTQHSNDDLNPLFEHRPLHLQMNRKTLDKFIETIEDALKDEKDTSKQIIEPIESNQLNQSS